MKVLATHDGAFFRRDLQLLNAWLSLVPGNGAHNLRRLACSKPTGDDRNYLRPRSGGHATGLSEGPLSDPPPASGRRPAAAPRRLAPPIATQIRTPSLSGPVANLFPPASV